MNILDIGVIAMFALGALFGLLLGFVRGGLFILSWLGAGIATIFGFSYAQPYGRRFIENEFFADLAAGGAVFLVTLIVLFLLSSFIGGWVRRSRLNALDRSLGMLAGLATAALLITGGYVIAENMWKDSQIPALDSHRSGSVEPVSPPGFQSRRPGILRQTDGRNPR